MANHPGVQIDGAVCPNHKDMLKGSTFQWAFGILLAAIIAIGGMMRAGVASQDRLDACEARVDATAREAREIKGEIKADLNAMRAEMRELMKDLRQEIRRAP
jgi:hypothetical protein